MPDLVDVATVCRQFSLSKRQALYLINTRNVPVVTLNHRFYVRPLDIRLALASKKVTASAR
jgi:hypothetical protein